MVTSMHAHRRKFETIVSLLYKMNNRVEIHSIKCAFEVFIELYKESDCVKNLH